MKICKIKETCLYVQDLALAKAFYHENLGFPVIGHVPDSHIFFRVGNTVLLCFIPESSKEKASPPPHFAYGRQHVAFEVKREEYNAWKTMVEDKKIEIVQEQTWKEDLKSFYFHDPEGHLLEIVPEGMWD